MATLTRLSLIKILELVVICVILGIHANSTFLSVRVEDSFISIGAEVGYLIILVGLFAGATVGTPVNRRVELFYLLVGVGMFVASGAIVIDYYNKYGSYVKSERDKGLARGSLAIIEGALLLIDAFLTFRGES